MVSVIVTDEPGEWSRRSRDWQRALAYIGNIKITYATPETSKENGHAEKAISMAEQTIKAILMQNNLEPSWWAIAARDAEFLLNRMPNIACDSTAPISDLQFT